MFTCSLFSKEQLDLVIFILTPILSPPPVGQGQSGPELKWAPAQVSTGPSDDSGGDDGGGKWARAQVATAAATMAVAEEFLIPARPPHHTGIAYPIQVPPPHSDYM